MSDENVEEVPVDEAAIAAEYGLDLSKFQGDGTPSEPEPEEVEEVQDEEPDEVVEEAEAPEPEPEPEPKRPDLMDKEVQRFQQLNATLEKEIAKLDKDQSVAQVQRVEKAKTKLDKYLAEKGDVDPYEAVPDLASEIQADRNTVERLLQEHEALKRQMAEQQQAQRAAEAQMRFATDYPDLRGRYTEFAQKAHEDVADTFGDRWAKLSLEDYEAAAGKAFMRLVNEAVAEQEDSKAEPAPAKTVDTAKKPKGSRIIKKQSGSSMKQEYDPEAEIAKLLNKPVWD